MIIKDIAQYEENDSELAKYTIQTQQEEIERLKISLEAQEEMTMNWYNKVNKAIEFLKLFDDNSTLIDHSIIKGTLNILKG